MSTVVDLLAEIDVFLRDEGVAETTFGRRAVNDGKFVARLRNGKGVTVATVERVRAYMATARSGAADAASASAEGGVA